MKNNGAKTQALHEYGLNAQIYNFKPYGGREIIAGSALISNDSGSHYQNNSEFNFTESEIGKAILNDEWFGIEYRVKSSIPN
jgi:hypothetical protein